MRQQPIHTLSKRTLHTLHYCGRGVMVASCFIGGNFTSNSWDRLPSQSLDPST